MAPVDPRVAGRRRRRCIAGLLLAPCLLYGAVLLALWQGQERLLFHPDPLPAGASPMDGPLPADVRQRTIQVPGATLTALHLQLPQARGLVFFLHGNAGNLRTWFTDLDRYRQWGYDLYMPDYRGFGLSTGRIESEAQLQADVRAAWDQVAPAYRGRPIVLYGRSLGTGLAARLAADLHAQHVADTRAGSGAAASEPPALLMLVSPYRSLAALAAELYPYAPSALLRYPLRTDRALASLPADGPPAILLLHGDQDTLIPIHHSEQLQAEVPRARLVRVPGAGHGDIHRDPVYREAVRSALDGLARDGGRTP